MDRNPGRWVIFVDVDCRILKPLDERVNSFRDVGFYVQSRFRRGGGAKLRVRPGTLILAPTPAVRHFVVSFGKRKSVRASTFSHILVRID